MTREYTYRWTQWERSVSPPPDRVHTTQRHALEIEDAEMTWTRVTQPPPQSTTVASGRVADSPPASSDGDGALRTCVHAKPRIQAPPGHMGDDGPPSTPPHSSECTTIDGAPPKMRAPSEAKHTIPRDYHGVRRDAAPTRPRTVRIRAGDGAGICPPPTRRTRHERIELGAGAVYRRRIVRKATP